MINFYKNFEEKYGDKNLVDDYFENNYFSPQGFLVNFFSRKKGMRWNGRFKGFINKNRNNFILDVFKSTKKGFFCIFFIDL